MYPVLVMQILRQFPCYKHMETSFTITETDVIKVKKKHTCRLCLYFGASE